MDHTAQPHKQKLTEIGNSKVCTTWRMSPVLLIAKACAHRLPLFSCVNALASVCFFSAVAVVLLFCAVGLLFRCSVVPFCAVVLSCSCSVVLCCSVVLLFCCSVLPQKKTQVFAAPAAPMVHAQLHIMRAMRFSTSTH